MQRRVGDWVLVPDHEALEKIPLAIDPPGCGCTECLTGLYAPLDMATDEQLEQMRRGKINNNTGHSWIPLSAWK